MDQYSGTEPPQFSYGSGTGSGSFGQGKVEDSCKPTIALLHLAFKLIPIAIYLIFKLATDQYLSTFIVVALLLSADFWVTKNISGRQLAALRWYTKLSEDNTQKWCFQSSDARKPSSCNVLVFWLSQLVAILFWVSIVLVNIITLSAFWVFLAIFCLLLLIFNFIFFLECKGEHQQKVNTLTKRVGVQFFDLHEEK